MKVALTFWWVLLWYGNVGFGGMFDWTGMKEQLDKLNDDSVMTVILDNWEERPSDFFHGMNEEVLRRIPLHLSDFQKSKIQPEEFKVSEAACKVFARHLPKLSRTEALPTAFREAVCDLIRGKKDQGSSTVSTMENISGEMIELIESIPSVWMNTHGESFLKALSESRLKYLSKEALVVLLNNPNNACQSITLDMLLSLSPGQLGLISPECLNAIKQLGLMNLSGIVKYFRKDIFAQYNGPLSKETIKQLSSEQVRYYGSLSKEEHTCKWLELHYLNPTSATFITTNCLYGYLCSYNQSTGLGQLWKSIPVSQVKKFTKPMRPSLVRIPLKDFDSMNPKILKVILEKHKICPTIETSFWTEEKRIQYISAQCLYKIFTQRGPIVKLGELWQWIGQWVTNSFTIEMMHSWLNIDHGDFYFMRPDTLKVISSGPGVCSTIDTLFWTEERIKNISGRCLYEIIVKQGGTAAPVKLGSLWKYIPLGSVYGLTEYAKSLWSFIHGEDHNLVLETIERAIESFPGICTTLHISFWTKQTIKYVTEDCLYRMLNEKGNGGTLALGELWKDIPSTTIECFERWEPSGLGNVLGSDFQHMPSELLSRLFSLDRMMDYLPQPFNKIIISSKASNVAINPKQFATLTRSAPNVSGQLLWYSMELPEDVLSCCNGNDIRSLRLALPGEIELNWKELFLKLKENWSLTGRGDFFSRMVRLVSEKVKRHFCRTLVDIDEYLSLTWLYPNLGGKCRSALLFDPEYIYKLFNMVDNLDKVVSYWREMLKIHSIKDWAWLSQSKRVGASIGSDCEFWEEINTGGWPEVLKGLGPLVFNSITPDCVLKIGDTLHQNSNLIPLLSNHAFSKYQLGQLPFNIKDLSPGQLSQVSKQAFEENARGGAIEQVPLCHVLSGTTLDDFKALNLEQFGAIYKSQWTFVPKSIKSEALSWQLKIARHQVPTIISSLSDEQQLHFDNNSHGEKFKTVVEIISLLLEMYRNGDQGISDAGLLSSIITFVRNSELRDTFLKVFGGGESSMLEQITIGLLRNAKELRDYNHVEYKKVDTGHVDLIVPHESNLGFSRSVIIQLLNSTPQSFAAISAQVKTKDVTDTGGVIRALTHQLLNDIERDLVVPHMQLPRGRKGGGPLAEMEVCNTRVDLRSDNNVAKNAKDDFKTSFSSSMDTTIDIDDSINGNAKFRWGISREVGLFVGLAFGKALQLDIRLPFKLDLEFYNLFTDSSDGEIEKYYSNTFGQDILKFEQGIVSLLNDKKFKKLLYILPRPERLRFTKLSAKASFEEAKADVMAKTNLWACHGDQDCYEDIRNLQDRNFQQEYIKSVLGRVLAEFKEFIRELVKGFAMVLSPVNRFSSFPRSIVHPFAQFLPDLLNAVSLRGEYVLTRVKFNRDHLVKSLIQGQTIAVSRVFSAFVLSLEGKQLENLIGIWTGASTLSLKYFELGISFIPPGTIKPYQVNFCEPENTTIKSGKDYLIASGEEYLKFFKKFSRNLLGPDVKIGPDCSPERVGIIPIRVSACAKSLMIYLQSTEQIFNSLVDLLQTTLTTFWDNQ